MNTDLLGAIAATLTTISFVPQAWKVIREKDTHAISRKMYILFSAGVACWLLYGIALESWPIIGANAVTLVLALIILITKFRYG